MALSPRLAALVAYAAAMVFPPLSQAFPIFPPPVLYVSVKEYVNEYTRHYVLLADPAEIALVEQGQAGPGWRWTGYIFSGFALSESSAEAANAKPVCRFYAPAPTNSHFFTADAAECQFLKTHDTGWIYEKIDFKIDVQKNGACADGNTPIYRAYNNRWMFSDSNHRFTSDERIRAKLAQAGWIDEGIAFCSRSAGKQVERAHLIAGTDKPPTGDCGSESSAEGPCVALNGLLDMREKMDKYLPPVYAELNPSYSTAFADMTGWLPRLDTVFSASFGAGAPSAARGSFVQQVVGGMPLGIHVNGADRLGGSYASISPLYRFTTSVPAAPGGSDRRFKPWGDGRDRDLFVSFQMGVKTIRRANSQSHAYGHPLIDFRDVTSGQHVYVTLQAYGTNAPGDFVGLDASTGHAIVSTVFRADPLFGKRVQGDFIACTADANGGACAANGIDFNFRIDADDFARILGFARTVKSSLSPRPADYVVADFQFRNETFLDAEVGLVVHRVMLSVTY
jgi:hypothetical protein